MNSPFLFQNITALLLLGVIFASCLYLLLSRRVSKFIYPRSKILLVLYRAATTVCFSVSLIGLISGIWLFYEVEIDAISRACWKRTYTWQTITPEMPQREVAEILGSPFQRLNLPNHEEAVYCLSPLGGSATGIVTFKKNESESELTVSDKIPADQAVLENLRGWIPAPSSNTYANYSVMISDSSSFGAFYGLLGLAILSLYPFKLNELSALRMIYLPLGALTLKTIYENHQAAEWHFGSFSISQLVTVILIAWIIRLGLILGRD